MSRRANETTGRSAKLAVLAAAAGVSREWGCFAIVGFLAGHAEAYAGDCDPPRLRNGAPAVRAVREPRALRQSALRAQDAILHCRIDLILNRAIACPTCRHRTAPENF